MLFEVETDKAVMGMESNEEGYLAEIIVRPALLLPACRRRSNQTEIDTRAP